MNIMSYTVAQNTSFLTISSVMQKIISFAYFTLIARFIGVENTGQYFFAITFTTIFVVLADFGLAPVLTREAARYPENSEKYVNTVLWSKFFFGLAAYVLVAAIVNIAGYPADTKLLVYLSGVTMFFDNMHSAFYSIFRARKNLRYEAYGITASQFITLVIGTVALFKHWPLVSLIAAYTIPSILNTIYAAYFARKVYGLRYKLAWDKQIFGLFFRMAVPFALAGFIGRLYAYSDSLIMSKILSREALGLWSVPYKITFAFQFIATALVASVYPVFSSLYIQDKAKISELFEKSWKYLFIIVFPLSFGIMAIAEPTIVSLFGESYRASVWPLRILLASLIFGYLSFITGALLNAVNRQRIQTTLIGAALGVNVALNLIFLQRYGIIAAAAAALLSNIILCVGGYIFVSRSIALRHSSIVASLNRTFWPGAIMGIASYLLTFKLHFILVIPIAAALYAALLFATGGMSVEMARIALQKAGIMSGLKGRI